MIDTVDVQELKAKRQNRLDFVLVSLWFFVTFKQFRFDELILYPLALYFAWAFLRDFHKIFPLISRSFVLFLFPIWWLLTAFWGAETALIIRSGLQLTLTIMICYFIATRLTARDLILALALTATYYAVLSFLAPYLGTGTPARGVFSSKNAMGTAMTILWLCSLCIVLDPEASRKRKTFGAFALLLAAWQIHMANSATAVLLAAGISFLIAMLVVIPRSGVLKRRWFYVGTAICVGIALISAAAFFSFQSVDPISAVLGAFGKDGTLTGRTVLWEYADRQIEENPMLGVGTGGFWTPYDKLSEASRIYEEFHKASYATFSFHNSYYEVAVHQGLVGVFFCALMAVWTVSSILLARSRANPIPTAFFLCVSAVALVRSMTESDFIAPFALLTMLFLSGGLMSAVSRLKNVGMVSENRERFTSIRLQPLQHTYHAPSTTSF